MQKKIFGIFSLPQKSIITYFQALTRAKSGSGSEKKFHEKSGFQGGSHTLA